MSKLIDVSKDVQEIDSELAKSIWKKKEEVKNWTPEERKKAFKSLLVPNTIFEQDPDEPEPICA